MLKTNNNNNNNNNNSILTIEALQKPRLLGMVRIIQKLLEIK